MSISYLDDDEIHAELKDDSSITTENSIKTIVDNLNRMPGSGAATASDISVYWRRSTLRFCQPKKP